MAHYGIRGVCSGVHMASTYICTHAITPHVHDYAISPEIGNPGNGTLWHHGVYAVVCTWHGCMHRVYIYHGIHHNGIMAGYTDIPGMAHYGYHDMYQ